MDKNLNIENNNIDNRTDIINENNAKLNNENKTITSSKIDNTKVIEVENKGELENLEDLPFETQIDYKKQSWKVALAPHLRTKNTTQRVMLDVIIALLPQLFYSIYIFGYNALVLTLISVVSCVFFEAMTQKAFKKPILIYDLSAVVTGMLLAFNIPANAPWWLPIVGSLFAIVFVKEFFGGIGSNFVNPALAGRAILMLSWPAIMTNYIGPDGITGATPLQILKGSEGILPSLKDMFFGNIGGVLGETSAFFLLIGFLYLVIRKVVDYKITIIYILSTMVVLFGLGVRDTNLLYHLLGGGLILGACFMATDYATAPISNLGKVIYAVLCGVLTALIRLKGGMPEGVSYSILILNICVPLIDRLTIPRVFGEVKKHARKS